MVGRSTRVIVIVEEILRLMIERRVCLTESVSVLCTVEVLSSIGFVKGALPMVLLCRRRTNGIKKHTGDSDVEERLRLVADVSLSLFDGVSLCSLYCRGFISNWFCQRGLTYGTVCQLQCLAPVLILLFSCRLGKVNTVTWTRCSHQCNDKGILPGML